MVSHKNPYTTDEICVIPNHLEYAKYKGKLGANDIENEKELCSISLYLEGPSEQTGGAAVCPKVNNTSAGIEFQTIPVGQTKEELEGSSKCGYHRTTSKLGSFRTTDNDRTCTYAPGAMFTYHLSRVLGDILNVPVMVLRTVAIPKFQEVAERALSMRINSNLRRGYQNYLNAFSSPTRWDYKKYIFTSDYLQVFGVIKAPVKGDTKLSAWTEYMSSERFESLESIRQIFSSQDAKRLFGETFNKQSLQSLEMARDYSDLIVLDQLTSQADRYTGSNLSSLDYYYYIDNDKRLKSVKKRSVDKGKTPMPENAILVKRLVANDNDCTFVNGNTNAKRGYVGRLRHMHPQTYQGVLRLAKAWKENSKLNEFMSQDLGMDSRYISKFAENLLSVEKSLKQNCLDKSLHLDLDPQLHFFGVQSSDNCELTE